MTAIEIFSSSVNYKYKSKICSISFLVVLFFITLSFLSPFCIIYNAGGFSVRNRVYAETPDTSFNYKYILLAYRDYKINPIVCSTFTTYKNNKVTDDCILVKVQEIDTNSDGIKDILKFEAQFYTDKPIKSLKLLLFFNFTLKELFQVVMESIAVLNHMLNDEVQKVQFSGDLTLEQKGLLNSEGLYKMYNHSIDVADYSLEELLKQNANRKFSAKISNEHVTSRIGFSKEDTVVVHGELMYRGQLIYYQPSIWEELKWTWIQYLSCLLVFAYIAKHILIFLFSNKYLNCYIMIPWKTK
ncbi:PREDICTED: transmembrane protein 231-like [Dufourea novaeangliae]|uniref:transmembrane protein 231-like n=1 Tax=Dufourea novaeangliae TaxID=178035 RepID=UPI0007674523|nr:PREDICTED: transmembrane protein 231-like [Dufourea novaeangliae]